ncbi:hypothetical protein B0T17DRAFT_264054 [Bombardia bombarda]|uniref:Uncharacterized protein n=1 Tax=Bombardia bombarda TaxID=252184 RepID=A0AA40C4V9_9PEZI|nr:hypothetical protein B0T17DRAFT_264054 [Bombardia bombarda]
MPEPGPAGYFLRGFSSLLALARKMDQVVHSLEKERQTLFTRHTAGDDGNKKLFAFRAHLATIDPDKLDQARRRINLQFVAGCVYLGNPDDPQPLQLYDMDNPPPARSLLQPVRPSPDALARSSNTVEDWARWVC